MAVIGAYGRALRHTREILNPKAPGSSNFRRSRTQWVRSYCVDCSASLIESPGHRRRDMGWLPTTIMGHTIQGTSQLSAETQRETRLTARRLWKGEKSVWLERGDELKIGLFPLI